MLYLPDLSERVVYSGTRSSATWVWGSSVIFAAAWSSDEAHLAFVGQEDEECALYFAQGDGTQMQRFAAAHCAFDSLVWSDKRTVIFQDKKYVLDTSH